MTQTYSLDLSLVSPGPGFTRLQTADHEGIHTGGLFLSPDESEVWKPLDVRPYANAEFRIDSYELEVLQLMAGQPGFPVNWRSATANGRNWLIRPFVLVVGETFHPSQLTLADALHIEQGVRLLNSRFWQVADHLNTAIDPESEQLFILDLSAAGPMGQPGSAWKADDSCHLLSWFERIGQVELRQLRQAGLGALHHVLTIDEFFDDDQLRHVYRITQGSDELSQLGLVRDGWLFARSPLSDEQIAAHALTWAYSPIPYEP